MQRLTTIKDKFTLGISSKTEDNKHIIFFDYDTNDFFIIERELSKLQNIFKLSDIYIIKSKHGYNAFCIDKVTLKQLKNIYSCTDILCKDFIRLGFKRKLFVIRSGIDKTFFYCLPSTNNKYKKSLAHTIYFNYVLNYPILKRDNYDNYFKCSMIFYRSVKHGFISDNQLKTIKGVKSGYGK